MQPDPELVNELVSRILSVVQPIKIILFGSAERGEMTPDSDLDVLVVVAPETDLKHTINKIYRNLIGFGIAADVIVTREVDLEQYGDNYSLIYYPALHEGREIYVA